MISSCAHPSGFVASTMRNCDGLRTTELVDDALKLVSSTMRNCDGLKTTEVVGDA